MFINLGFIRIFLIITCGYYRIRLTAIANIAGAQNGEVQLGFYLCKGTLEVEVICARDICLEEKEEPGNLRRVPSPFAVNSPIRVIRSLFAVTIEFSQRSTFESLSSCLSILARALIS